MAQLLDIALKFYALLAATGNFDNKQQGRKRRIHGIQLTHKTRQTTRQTVGHTFYGPTLNRGHLNRNKVGAGSVCSDRNSPLPTNPILSFHNRATHIADPQHKIGRPGLYANTFHKFIYTTRCLLGIFNGTKQINALAVF